MLKERCVPSRERASARRVDGSILRLGSSGENSPWWGTARGLLMKMKLALAAALAMGAVALPAAAAPRRSPPPNSQYIFYNDDAGTGTFGGTVGSDPNPKGFTDSFTFQTADQSDDATITVTAGAVAGGSNLDITDVTFDKVVGENSGTAADPRYVFSDVPITAGLQTISVSGSSTGSFSGTIEVAQTSAAPEPSAWLLMIAGVAGSGLMLRRARKQGDLSLRSLAA